MSNKIHIRSLQSTLKENSAKAKKYTKELVYWVIVLAVALLCIVVFYSQHKWLYYITSIALLIITLYYFNIVTRCWQTNKKLNKKYIN